MYWPFRNRSSRTQPGETHEGTTFAEAMAAAESEALHAPRLVDMLGRTRLALDGVTHVTGQDESDLYHWVDELSRAVVSEVPGSLCQAGCSRCCHYPTAFFDIYPGEWQPIEKHLRETWSPERLHRFLARFSLEHAPYLSLIRLLEHGLRGMFRFHPTKDLLPLSCPFLEDDRCSIYEVRPFACRGFGHFAARLDTRDLPHVYGCKDQEEALMPALRGEGPRIQLPDIQPLWETLARVTGGHRHVLAIWIARRLPVPRDATRLSWWRIGLHWIERLWREI